MNRRLIIAAAFAGAAVCTAAADDDLPELVVDAWRRSVLPGDFAGNATVIERDAIARSAARSVADLLATEAGLRLSGTSGNRSNAVAQLRGFGENASSRTRIMIDGRPVNRSDMGAVSWFAVPIGQLERVEILRGAQTARFGDNAVGGVINLVTRRGGPATTAIEAAAGSDGHALARFGHRDTSGAHDFSVDLEHNVTDGWRDNAFSELSAAALRWTARPAPGVAIDLGLSLAEESAGFPGPLGTADYLLDPRRSIYVRSGIADQFFSETTRTGADVMLNLGPTDALSVEIPVSFLRRDLEWNFGPGFHADNRLDTLGVEPRLSFAGDRGSIDVGLAYRRDSLEVVRFAEIERIRRTADAGLTRDVLDLFANADWEPSEAWVLRGSARLAFSSIDAAARSHRFPANPALNFARSGSETNHAFQIGATWKPRPDLSAWLRYDRLYRLPSMDEIASYQGFPLSLPFNDRLRAETGHNVELGAGWSPGAWTLRANAFAQWLDGEILYDFTRNLNVNLADTRRLGIETLIALRGDRWEATLRHTALEAEFYDGPYAGNEVYLVPNHEVTGTLAIRPADGLTIRGEYQWIGASHEGNDVFNRRPKLPAYGVANLLVRYEPQPALSLYLRIDNLLDKRYAALKSTGLWYPGAGRQIIAGIRYEL